MLTTLPKLRKEHHENDFAVMVLDGFEKRLPRARHGGTNEDISNVDTEIMQNIEEGQRNGKNIRIY